MKLALVWPSNTTKGVAENYYNVQSLGLGRVLARMGFEVLIYTARNFPDKNKSIIPCVASYLQYSHNTCRILYMQKVFNFLRYPILKGLFKNLREFSPTIIQSTEDISPCTIMAFLYALFARKPFIVYQGIYSHPVKYMSLSKFIRRTIIQPVYRLRTIFLVKSSAAKQFLIDYGVPEERIKVVYVGFSPDHFSEVDSTLLYELADIPKNKRILLNVGRLASHKNQIVMIEAMAKLREQHPDVALVLLGDGPDLNRVLAKISDLNLENVVKVVTTKIPQTEMAKIYSSAYIYLCPSLREIFGMTILEAMACGRPVIGSNVGGIPEVVKHGVNGFIIDPLDVEGLYRYISILLEDHAKYDFFRSEALKTSKKYSWDVIAKNFVEVYEKVYTDYRTKFHQGHLRSH